MNDSLFGNMLKYDSRENEPKPYSALILTVAVAFILAIMINIGTTVTILIIPIIIYLLLMIGIMIYSYIRQIESSPYSYNMIYFRGFALFFFFVLLSLLSFTVHIIKYPDAYTPLDIIWAIMDSAVTYVIVSFPLIIGFSIWFFLSNLNLIKHEGKRLANILGIILAFLMLAGIGFLALYSFRIWPFDKISFMPYIFWEIFFNIFAVTYLYFECMLIGSILAVLIVSHYEPRTDKDFVIILGCRIRKDGTPTPILKGRIDRALAFYKKQKEASDKELIFVTSGGKGPDEVISESACMKKYLMEHGIPEDQIIEEDKSTNTFENMKFSKEKIWAIDPDAKVAFSTTNYHVFRSGLYARRLGMRAVGMGQPTKWWFWPNAAVREFVGLLTEHRKLQIFVYGCLIAVYILLTILSYK